MKILSTNFVEPFVTSICPLFYYEFNEWLEKGNKSERRNKTAQTVMVFGTAEAMDTDDNYRYIGTAIFVEGKFYFIPFVNLVNSEQKYKYEAVIK